MDETQGPPNPFEASPDQPGAYGPPSDAAPSPYEASPDQPGAYGPPGDLAPPPVGPEQVPAAPVPPAQGTGVNDALQVIGQIGQTAGQIAGQVVQGFRGAQGLPPGAMPRTTPPAPFAPPAPTTVSPAAQPPRVPILVAPPMPASPPAMPQPAGQTALIGPVPQALGTVQPQAPSKIGVGTYVAVGVGAAALISGIALLATSGRKRRERSL